MYNLHHKIQHQLVIELTKQCLYVLKDYIIENRGGKPRYNYIHQPPENLNNLTKLGRKYLKQYLIKKGLEKKVSNNNVRKMIF